MTEQPDPSEPIEPPPTPEEAVPWPSPVDGEGGDVLSRLESEVTAGFREAVAAETSRGGLLRTLQRLQGLLNRLQAVQVEGVAKFDRTAGQPSNVALELSLGL